MRRVLLALALIQSSLGSAAVFGTDDRITLRDRAAEAKVIGMALYGDRQTTAFLVDQCFAVTSQHLVGSDRNPLGAWVQLVLGRERVYAQAVRAGHQEQGASRGYNKDWLLLKLAQCRRGGPVVELASDVAPAPALIRGIAGRVTTIGYPSDLQRLVADPDCRIREVGEFGWLNDCAAQPGSSGSPLLVRHGKRLVAYAIQSGAFPTSRPEAWSVERANLATPVLAVRQALLEERWRLASSKWHARSPGTFGRSHASAVAQAIGNAGQGEAASQIAAAATAVAALAR